MMGREVSFDWDRRGRCKRRGRAGLRISGVGGARGGLG